MNLCVGLMVRVFTISDVIWVRAALIELLLGFYLPLIIYKKKKIIVGNNINVEF